MVWSPSYYACSAARTSILGFVARFKGCNRALNAEMAVSYVWAIVLSVYRAILYTAVTFRVLILPWRGVDDYVQFDVRL